MVDLLLLLFGPLLPLLALLLRRSFSLSFATETLTTFSLRARLCCFAAPVVCRPSFCVILVVFPVRFSFFRLILQFNLKVSLHFQESKSMGISLGKIPLPQKPTYSHCPAPLPPKAKSYIKMKNSNLFANN